jgi:hypothetical protein
VVVFPCLRAKGFLGMNPTKISTQKCGIFYFFIFFKGIHELQTRKARKSGVCTLVTRGWQQKYYFLDEFDAGGWDLSFQSREND